ASPSDSSRCGAARRPRRLRRRGAGVDLLQVVLVGGAEVNRRWAVEDLAGQVGLDGPVHNRARIGRVARVVGIVTVSVEVEVDQTQQVAEFVDYHRALDACTAHEGRRDAGDLVGEDRGRV